MLITIPTSYLSQTLNQSEVIEHCKQARRMEVEIMDPAARVIASYFQSSGTVGRHMARLASGLPTSRSRLLTDLSFTIRECYGSGDPDTDLMLDMFGTWLINHQ